MIKAEYVALFELQKSDRSDDVRMLAVIQENLSHLGFSKKRNHLSTISRFNDILKQTAHIKELLMIFLNDPIRRCLKTLFDPISTAAVPDFREGISVQAKFSNTF